MSTEEMQNSNPLQDQITHILSGNVEGFEERVHEWQAGEMWDRFPEKFAMRYDGGRKYFTLIRDGDHCFTYPTDVLVQKIDGVSILDIYDRLQEAGYAQLFSGNMPAGITATPEYIASSL